MSILLRSHKGAPLTAAEMDANMNELDQRLKRLEDLSMAETKMTVEHRNGLLVFKNGLNEACGRAELPRWTPRLRGEWQAGGAYAVGDWVRFKGKVYVCKGFHVAPFAEMRGEAVNDAIKVNESSNASMNEAMNELGQNNDGDERLDPVFWDVLIG